jgi:tRNA-2-methylthio-N6-dimethylallyladenosine synthase
MGCFVSDPTALGEQFPHVSAFFQPSDVGGVVDYARRWQATAEWSGGDGHRMAAHAGARGTATPPTDLVPISYGCDHHCTYCIVTIRRGPQRSRPLDEILADAKRLVERGAREITLLGQNVDAYGHDLAAIDGASGPGLADVLEAVHAIEGLERIRFLTSHPKEMTPRIIDAVAALPKVCECWELPVQSGDDEVLRRMGRGYTVGRFRDLVAQVRAAAPDSAINTDIIVGFPGETDAQFENSLRLVQELRFQMIHVASYSVRPGTPAARLADDVPPEVKEARRQRVESAQESIARELNAALLDRVVEVLVDGRQKGRWRGRTRTNTLVFFDSPDDWLGHMAHVRITWAGPWSVSGHVSNDVPS